MGNKNKIKENNFDTAQAGVGGAISYTSGWGTFSSPDVSQDPASFVKSRSIGSNSNTVSSSPSSKAEYNQVIDKIYKKKTTPSPDEILTGLKYELQNMIKKDKAKAKEIVLNNIRQDPHYYGKLGMLNIEDDDMMKTNPMPQSQEDQMNERIRLLNQMIESKVKKVNAPQSIKDALKDTRDRKNKRYTQ